MRQKMRHKVRGAKPFVDTRYNQGWCDKKRKWNSISKETSESREMGTEQRKERKGYRATQ